MSTQEHQQQDDTEAEDGEQDGVQRDNRGRFVGDDEEVGEQADGEEEAEDQDADEEPESESDPQPEIDNLTVEMQADRLENILDLLLAFSDEAVLHIGADGLEACLVDAANVRMVDLQADAEAFEATGVGSFPIGVSLIRFSDILAKATSQDVVELSYVPETNKMSVEYGHVSSSLACLDPDTVRSQPGLPDDLELPNVVGLETRQLKDAVDMVDIVSDHMHIRPDVKRDAVQLVGEGDTDDMVIEYRQSDAPEDAAWVVDEDVSSLFTLLHLEKLVGGIPAKDTAITIRWGDEYPCVCEFEFGDGTIEVEAMIAPRISRH